MQNKINQSGRSMVEMLGVLAIIGVLSVGGIAGYTMAMNKHRANKILNAASVRAMVVSTKLQYDSTADISNALVEFGNETIAGVSFTKVEKGTGTFTFTLSGVSSEACAQMKNVVGDSGNVNIGDCPASGTGSVVLTYNNDLGSGTSAVDPIGACTPACSTTEECVDGFCIAKANPNDNSCAKNDDCKTKAMCEGETCYCAVRATYDSNSISCYKNYTGTCTVIAGYDITPVDGTTFFIGPPDLTWWSAQNFCKANRGSMVKLSDLNCSSESIDLMKSKGFHGCCITGTGCASGGDFGPPMSESSQMTDEFNIVASLSGMEWLYDERTSCDAFIVNLSYPGIIASGYRYYGNTALCKGASAL